MTQSKQIVFQQPITSVDITCTDGFPAEVTVTKSASSETTITFSLNHESNEESVVAEVSEKGRLSVSTTGKKRGILNLLSFGGSTTPKITLGIQIPDQEINDLNVVSNLGSFKYDGPNVRSKVSAVLNMGEVKIIAPLTVNDIDISADKGAVSITNATVANTALFNASMGEIKGAIWGYRSLNAKANMGAAKFELRPGAGSTTTLESNMGEVTATVFGYHGRFSASSSFGGVKVDAPGTKGNRSNPCTGFVGEETEKGASNLTMSANMGGVNLTFVE